MGDINLPNLLYAVIDITTKVNNNWSSNGDYSVESTITGGENVFIGYRSGEYGIGETVTFQCDVNTPIRLYISIYYYTDEYHVVKSSIPANSIGNFKITASIPSDATISWFRLDVIDKIEDQSFQTDNWSITIQ